MLTTRVKVIVKDACLGLDKMKRRLGKMKRNSWINLFLAITLAIAISTGISLILLANLQMQENSRLYARDVKLSDALARFQMQEDSRLEQTQEDSRLYENDVVMDGTVHYAELHLAGNCGLVTCHYKLGDNVHLGNAAISGDIEIGANTSIGEDSMIYGNVKIGKNVVIQSDVYVNGREYYKDNGIWHLNMDKATIHNITIPDGAWIPVGSKIRNQEDADKVMIL